MTEPPVLADADIAYVRKFFVALDELCAQRDEDAAAVRIAIAEAHGGKLTLTSIPDEGATFTIALPVR